MKGRKISKFTMFVCTVACCFMVSHIIKDYVRPILNGTIADLPEGKVYSLDDISDEVADFVEPGTDRYAYKTLDDNEQQAYERLLMGICSFADRIDIKSCEITMDELRNVYSCMRNDYPELFWIYNNCEVYSSDNIATDCIPQYLYSSDDVTLMISNIEQVRDALISPIEKLSDYEKVMYVFNYIIDSTVYDLESYNDYETGELTANLELSCNIYGTLIKNQAMCEGYSKTFQYLLNSMGIECLYVSGEADGEGHAWNYVKLDGEYYAMDLTWCDPKGEEETKSYAYCLVDYDTLKKSHAEDVPYELPECEGRRYNYYTYNGYHLSVYNPDDIEDMLYRAYCQGAEFAEIKCETAAVYDQVVNAIKNQDIFRCFESIEENFGKYYDSINYGLLEDVWVIRIKL